MITRWLNRWRKTEPAVPCWYTRKAIAAAIIKTDPAAHPVAGLAAYIRLIVFRFSVYGMGPKSHAEWVRYLAETEGT